MLLALCNDVLDLAKIDAGRFELNPQPNDVAALLGETVELFSPQVTAKGLSLELQVSPTLPPRLVVDRLRMQQLLMNLIGNAAKFTRQGGIRVVVQWQATHQEAGQIHVAVVDTGPGLNAEQRARLFQEFSQADASVAQQHGGTGLGLALCRSLVTLMGGTIGLDSEPGQGSTFWFEVPLNTVGAPLVVG
jgi:signal transduction histidine kinase